MKTTTSIIISSATILIGLIIEAPYIWIPISVLIAGIIDIVIRDWVMSDRLGSAQTISTLIKLFFSLAMVYASWGQFICVAITIYWFWK
jgi:hypothetical protein